jgi:hypothetical protein
MSHRTGSSRMTSARKQMAPTNAARTLYAVSAVVACASLLSWLGYVPTLWVPWQGLILSSALWTAAMSLQVISQAWAIWRETPPPVRPPSLPVGPVAWGPQGSRPSVALLIQPQPTVSAPAPAPATDPVPVPIPPVGHMAGAREAHPDLPTPAIVLTADDLASAQSRLSDLLRTRLEDVEPRGSETVGADSADVYHVRDDGDRTDIRTMRTVSGRRRRL